MRLIDADALFRAYERVAWYNNADRDELAEELLSQVPTVDAVEVVRCKDCKWYGGELKSCIFCLGGEYLMKALKPDDFCSCGARMDGGDDNA